MTDLSSKCAIVTGASKGIGAETARVLAEAGANVVLAARSEAAIAGHAEEIRRNGGSAMAMATDVSRIDEARALTQRATEAFGAPDILICNAGVIDPISHLATSDPEAWSHAIDINLKGVYYGIRTVLEAMMARGSGTIIIVGSGAAHNALEGWSHYCTSKAGALMLTRAVHKEAGHAGVRSINLSPGTVATDMQVEIKASGLNPVSQLDPSVHIPPSWPARAMLWLCGPAGARFMGEEVSLRDEGIRAEIGLV